MTQRPKQLAVVAVAATAALGVVVAVHLRRWQQRKRRAAILRSHIRALVKFYEPIVVDPSGGYFNQLRDDGTIYDQHTKHVVGTCRFSVNFSLVSRIMHERAAAYRALSGHGIRFLIECHADPLPVDGFTWVLEGRHVSDGHKYCYSVAFALLALANAHLAGVPDVLGPLNDVLALAEGTYFEAQHGLYIDSFDRTLKHPSPYRGQNANMHMCEALIAVYEACGDVSHLARAALLARRLTVELADPGTGWVVEHYTSDWIADPHKNRDATPGSEEYIFRPPGFQPGHAVEWAKLLVLLERHSSAAGGALASGRGWMLPTAERLFERATQDGWDAQRGGLVYLVQLSADGSGGSTATWRDGNKYYWALAEMIGAAGLLAVRTGKQRYWGWYDAAWACARECFIDAERGGWYPMLNEANERVDPYAGEGHTGPPVKCYPSKTDYHPLAACWEVLRALEPAEVEVR